MRDADWIKYISRWANDTYSYLDLPMKGWIGVDLDGTLAHYDGWKSPEHIGDPVPAMLKRVTAWLAEGREVRIFTARVSHQTVDVEAARIVIQNWCLKHVGIVLEVTCSKDFNMIELWDDRCVQVQSNTGVPVHKFWKHTL